MTHAALFPALRRPDDTEALRFGDRALTYTELAAAAGGIVDLIDDSRRVAVWATAELETCVAVVGALAAGAAVVPINPKVGERELAHILGDSAPDILLVSPRFQAPQGLGGIDVREVDLAPGRTPLPEEPDAEAPALIVYTSGTTGPPKGVVLPRRAIRANLDALATAWEWTARDVLVHALPLFHVHGLILGTLGPLRLGGTVHHLGRFSSRAVARELAGPATMLFGVPTMYHRLADDAEQDPELARAVGKARLLVSGSAALPAVEHERIARLTGQQVVERYGMSETIMNTGVRASGDRRPGYVGLPFEGVELTLVDEQGTEIERWDDETIGEILVRGTNLFTEYLNRPDATAAAFTDGWFRTGDMATRAPDGYVRIVGRKSTDIIKSGGYKIGAGEIENALLEHPAVAEVAVTGEVDPDLGERIVAWIVPVGEVPEQELVDHVANLLTPHKRPRAVRFVDSLPRNELGKVMKRALDA